MFADIFISFTLVKLNMQVTLYIWILLHKNVKSRINIYGVNAAMLTDKVQIMFLSPDPDHLQTCRQVDVLPKRSNLILHAGPDIEHLTACSNYSRYRHISRTSTEKLVIQY